jgi:hypothetical protein
MIDRSKDDQLKDEVLVNVNGNCETDHLSQVFGIFRDLAVILQSRAEQEKMVEGLETCRLKVRLRLLEQSSSDAQRKSPDEVRFFLAAF